MKNLTKLVLDWNNISNEGIISLMEIVIHSKSLVEIKLCSFG